MFVVKWKKGRATKKRKSQLKIIVARVSRSMQQIVGICKRLGEKKKEGKSNRQKVLISVLMIVVRKQKK